MNCEEATKRPTIFPEDKSHKSAQPIKYKIFDIKGPKVKDGTRYYRWNLSISVSFRTPKTQFW